MRTDQTKFSILSSLLFFIAFTNNNIKVATAFSLFSKHNSAPPLLTKNILHVLEIKNESTTVNSTRRQIFQKTILAPLVSSIPLIGNPKETYGAPPIAIIAEELGYFPITNRQGITQYVPAKVKRSSTDQSINLAKFLSAKGAIMYGTYWCGHTSHQKELFGKEAWDLIKYVECSPKGVYYDSEKLAKVAKNIDGFPTWYIPSDIQGKGFNRKSSGDWISGEMPLERIAALSGYKGEFDVQLEGPDISGTGSC